MTDDPRCYCIIRIYQGQYRSRCIRRGLTLAEAQAHCRDPETSSRTCTLARHQRRTRRYGPWFDAYEVQR